MEFDDFAKDYYLLGLRINKHIDGYVEHYYGPSEVYNISFKMYSKTYYKNYEKFE